jgi:hypothetical protein
MSLAKKSPGFCEQPGLRSASTFFGSEGRGDRRLECSQFLRAVERTRQKYGITVKSPGLFDRPGLGIKPLKVLYREQQDATAIIKACALIVMAPSGA